MPFHEKLRFSVWVQHGADKSEEYDVRCSRDSRVVNCWIIDDLPQGPKSIHWKSHGLGPPSKVRLSTERARVSQPDDDRTRCGSSQTQSSCEECDVIANKMDGFLCTVKVSVFMPPERREPTHCTGFVRIDQNEVLRREREGVCLPPASHYPEAVSNPNPSHQRLPQILPSSGDPTSIRQPPYTLAPEPYVTFVFRFRTREVLRAYKTIRSQSCTSRKRTRSPSPYARNLSRLPLKRSRSCQSDFGITEGYTRTGSPIVPYYVLPGSNKGARSGSACRGTPRAEGDYVNTKQEPYSPIFPPPFQHVRNEIPRNVPGIRSDLKEERLLPDQTTDTDLEEDILLVQMEQQLLEMRKMILQLRVKRIKRQSAAARAT